MSAAQTAANQQRNRVTLVQQQIQVLAAEQRSIEEQSRQFSTRRERLVADNNALSAPDEARLLDLQRQLEEAREASEVADARLLELQEVLPLLDESRRTQQQLVNGESARQADTPPARSPAGREARR